MNVLVFLLVGLVSGWIANMLIKGRGLGALVNTVVGVIGAFIGGALFNAMGWTAYGFWGSVVISVVGAIVFLVVVGLISRYSSKR